MAYPSDGDPIKDQILDQLSTQLAAIATPTYHFDVVSARVFGGQQLQLGTALPGVVIVPISDTLLRAITTEKVERQMTVDIYCAVRVHTGRSDWRTEVAWLMSDVTKAINEDIQLSSLATYAQVEDDELPDAIDSNIATGRIGLTIVYRHQATDPASIT